MCPRKTSKHTLVLTPWVKVRGQGDWVMDTVLQASLVDQCSCLGEKEREGTKSTGGSVAVARAPFPLPQAEREPAMPAAPWHQHPCEVSLLWAGTGRGQESFVKSAGRTLEQRGHLGTSVMIGEDVKHQEMPDKGAVGILVTTGFTSKTGIN